MAKPAKTSPPFTPYLAVAASIWVIIIVICVLPLAHLISGFLKKPEEGLKAQPIFIRLDENALHGVTIPTTRWVFPTMGVESAHRILREMGVTSPKPFETFQEEGHTIVVPTTAQLKAMDPNARRELYTWLGQFPQNPQMVYPFCYSTKRLDQRFASIRPETRKNLEKFFYPGPEGKVLLADAGNACEGLDENEKARLIQGISEQETLLLTIAIGPKTDLEKVNDDWSLPNVTRDFIPLLRSIKASGQTVQLDLMHLLPRFVKGYVFTYPLAQMPSPEVSKDCFWTAMNFHNVMVDFGLHPEKIDFYLKNKFRLMPPGATPKLGDLLIYFDKNGKSIHVAVYIAEDIVFTKNGATFLSPWIFQRKEALEEVYPKLAQATVEIHRNIAALE